MNAAKIHLSEDELLLLQNAEWVLTKNKIIQKVYDLFGALAASMQEKLKNKNLPEAVLTSTPKISRGENYKGLPYVMLDYPRVFGKENVFAIRSFFWWGNYFSITLHLKGDYKRIFIDVIQRNIQELSTNHFFLAASDDEWKHEIDDQSHISLPNADANQLQQIFTTKDFLKLSAKIGFAEWNNAGERFEELLDALLKGISCRPD
ncbi:MAG: hypothetical protein JST96_02345 [Bacteroidetes bacterium]|nr:hypothetical protein [Bacteroidota bacterium]